MPKIVDKQPNQWMQKVRQENFLKGLQNAVWTPDDVQNFFK